MVIACDTEGNGLLDTCDTLYTFQYAYRGAVGEIISGVIHLFHKLGEPYELNAEVQALLTAQHSLPWFHNSSYDVAILRRFGYEVPDYHDTQIMGYCLNANVEPIEGEIHSLKAWGKRLQKLGIIDEGKGEWTQGFDEWVPEMDIYAEQDAVVTLHLAEYLTAQLQADPKGWQHYLNIELPYVEVIMALEASGLPLHFQKVYEALPKMEALLESRLAAVRAIVPLAPQGTTKKRVTPIAAAQVYQGDSLENFDNFSLQPRSGEWIFLGMEPDPKNPERQLYCYKQWLPLKPGSGDQVAWALKAYYGWEPTKFTDSGKPSTEGDVLEELDYPLAQAIVEYNEVEKVFNTFLGAFLRATDEDGYIRTGWNQTLTLTGRLSTSGNMNLQNLPAHTEAGNIVRECVVARPGFSFISCDLQAIEARMLWALISTCFEPIPDDARFALDSFFENKDYHTTMAELWFGHEPDYAENAKKYRSIGKNITYGNMFGFGSTKAAVMIGCTKERAVEYMDTANSSAPSLKAFKELIWDMFRTGGGVSHTWFGRRLCYPDICLTKRDRDSSGRRARAERQAFNATIQGSAADLLKLIQLFVLPFAAQIPGTRFLGAVHDELLFEVPEAQAQELCVLLNTAFAGKFLPFMPCDGNAQVGLSWLEVH